jgi:hypothetical protein
MKPGINYYLQFHLYYAIPSFDFAFSPSVFHRNVRNRKGQSQDAELPDSLLRVPKHQAPQLERRQSASDDEREEDDGVNILENTQCKFNVNSFRMVYVVNSESFLYKRNALKTAKEVSSLMLKFPCSRFLCVTEA